MKAETISPEIKAELGDFESIVEGLRSGTAPLVEHMLRKAPQKKSPAKDRQRRKGTHKHRAMKKKKSSRKENGKR